MSGRALFGIAYARSIPRRPLQTSARSCGSSRGMSRSAPVADSSRVSSSSSAGQPQQTEVDESESTERPHYGYKDVSAGAERGRAEATAEPSRPQLPGSIKKLNRLLGRQKLGEIPEHELKEQFVRGSGPGGQAINKTSSSVSLIHLPTGVRVQAQPTRSREANRKAARRILAEKLDLMIAVGSWSREGQAKPDSVVAGDGSPSSSAKSEAETSVPSRKESRRAEEVAMAEQWSRQEILWEKERRRKANRAKKSKRKKRDGEADEDDA